jgi:AAA domain
LRRPDVTGLPLLWLNGCFGSGKSTTAAALVRLCPRLLLFDPELVGFLLWEVDPSLRAQDFRDLPLWRHLVVETAGQVIVERQRAVVAPMSLFDPEHQLDVIGGLRARGVPVHHVLLDVGAAELRRRIVSQTMSPDPATDEGTRRFRLDQLAAGLAMCASPPADVTVVTVGDSSADEVARRILDGLPDAIRTLVSE